MDGHRDNGEGSCKTITRELAQIARVGEGGMAHLDGRAHVAECGGTVNHPSYWRHTELGVSVGPCACECFANGGTLRFLLATKSMTKGVPA